MNSVERVKTICKKRKLPISKLEKDLGYANGYIGQLRKGVFPDDRLVEIAAYLEVSTDNLLGKEKENAPQPGGASDDDIKFALFGTKDIDDDVYEQVKTFARFARDHRKDNKPD